MVARALASSSFSASAPAEYAALLDLYDVKGRNEITPEKFLRDGFFFLERMRTKLASPEERMRWRFYALYFHQQVLETAIDACPDNATKIALYKDMVALLKGTKDIRIVESNQLIRTPCWGQVRSLGETDRTDRTFPDVPALEISEERIMALYEKDRLTYPPSVSTVLREPLKAAPPRAKQAR